MSTARRPDLGGSRSHSGRPAWVTRMVLLAVALVATYVIVQLIGRIDWAAVRDALSLLTWWQPIVLFAVVVVRQVMQPS